jgi:hypothetical protein
LYSRGRLGPQRKATRGRTRPWWPTPVCHRTASAPKPPSAPETTSAPEPDNSLVTFP